MLHFMIIIVNIMLIVKICNYYYICEPHFDNCLMHLVKQTK